jgi:hypothetical protein
MAANSKPTLHDLADYFQQQADRTRNEDRKAHYRRCADEYRAKAKEAEQSHGTRDNKAAVR